MARFARRESTKICLFRLFLGYLGIWVCSRQLRGLISYCRVSYCHGRRCTLFMFLLISGGFAVILLIILLWSVGSLLDPFLVPLGFFNGCPRRPLG